MNRFTNLAVAGAIAVSGVMGGVIGAAMVGANAASNATPAAATAPAASSSAAPSTGAFRSNEDPTHEAGESAAREAAENNGTATYGPGGGGIPPSQ